MHANMRLQLKLPLNSAKLDLVPGMFLTAKFTKL